MRLINVHTLELKEFISNPPRYIALSHRWSDNEITFKDFHKKKNLDSAGYLKIAELCEFIISSWQIGVSWCWVDTCCIDKRSSAELSEAINSMWAWYKDCHCCVAYLEDVTEALEYSQFRNSVWFTRGWTLQELLAPRQVVFCTRKWDVIGVKNDNGLAWARFANESPVLSLSSEIEKASGIEQRYLAGVLEVMGACAAQKMSWASKRATTRGEDRAYSLLGLLDINMPLLYGEGERKAFLRLQEEFLRRSEDESIFSWTLNPYSNHGVNFGILAHTPSDFGEGGNVALLKTLYQTFTRRIYTITNKGLHFTSTGVRVDSGDDGDTRTTISEQLRVWKYGNYGLSDMEGYETEAKPGEQFIVSLSCTSTSRNHLKIYPNSDGLMLIVFEHWGAGRWYRKLPTVGERERYAALWRNGEKVKQTLLVVLQGRVLKASQP